MILHKLLAEVPCMVELMNGDIYIGTIPCFRLEENFPSLVIHLDRDYHREMLDSVCVTSEVVKEIVKL